VPNGLAAQQRRMAALLASGKQPLMAPDKTYKTIPTCFNMLD